MYYYDPNDRKPRLWAIAALMLYASLLAVAFVFVSFDFTRIVEKPGDTIEIELLELIPESPKPADERIAQTRVHEQPALQDRIERTEGPDETTRTPNPKALFHMNKGGVDEPENAGNSRAKEGEEKASGKGSGREVEGMDQLDRGLQGRGLVGDLPRPAYPGNASGKVVVLVTVGPAGEVESAAFEPKGSTTNDKRLIEAALEAARKARFSESAAAVQGGTITYIFRMK
ncbi:MAG: TonB family protein [Alistipes senegalensis]|nr:TonB family protein [Bacteroides cellulosilyticus]MCM1352769.1 TonB family protein [Alistipes senegalensis]